MPGAFDGFPRPPADLARRRLPVVALKPGRIFWRIHGAAFGPIFFGPGPGNPPRSRFDDPAGRYGVCYFGRTEFAAFAESFLRDLPARAISSAFLAQKVISECRVERRIKLAQAFGAGLAKLGTTAALAGARGSGGSYAHSQEWSRALHEHPDDVDGIAYQSSHDDSQSCVALFERAGDAIAAIGTSGTLDKEKALLADAVRRYDIGIF